MRRALCRLVVANEPSEYSPSASLLWKGLSHYDREKRIPHGGERYQWYVGLINPVMQPALMQHVVYLWQDKTTNHVELSKFGYGRERNRSSLRLNRILSPFASKS